jgi:hypothetical protein
MQLARSRVPRAFAVLAFLSLAACSGDSEKPTHRKPDGGGKDDAGHSPTFPGFFDGGDNPGLIDASGVMAEDAGVMRTVLVLTPGMGMVELDGANLKPIEFSALLSNGAPSEVPVRWSTDHRDLGAIDAMSGAFKPNGAAGVVTVTGKAGSLTTSVTITIVVKSKQEGDPDSGGMPAGAGGLGGVGGEGGGSKIADSALRDALDKPAAKDAELAWLYPYDGTVWPRGLPAPLLQWRHGAHVPVAVKLRIEVAPNYSADVYLGPPPGLAAGNAIDRIPIPQAIWKSALQSGTTMKVSLTVAASDGAGGFAAYAAASGLTWTIAPTTLRGTVYYNSYGTKLAENFGGAQGGGSGRFGGATLAIQRDAFDPTLIAGATTSDSSGCRVCHTVSANGSLMIAQHENNQVSSKYDLRNMNQELMYPAADNGKFGWAGLSFDGTIALGNSGPPSSSSNVANGNMSALYNVTDGTKLTAQGLSEFVTQAATPAFSLDTKKVAFNLYTGPGTASIPANGKSIVVMDIAKVDDVTYALTNPKALYTATVANQLPGWPAFLPDGSGVVFQLELMPGNGSEHFVTRQNARGELWWTDMNGHAHALERANGKGYLPAGAAGKNHDDDATLQYEPTVAPIVAGGYAWVVFTSRRQYGNVATRAPFESDARQFDLTAGNVDGPTTKKLWVTALDSPAKVDSDPSHPAFYLPAQELYAGNSRGYWVLDACKENAGACTGGDECCGGYCRVDPESGLGVCMDVPEDACSKEYDKCNVDSDCCADGKAQLYCIAGRCATSVLQ